ncbi:MAG: SUMF1/EgtB/PvdO family nonheme iron enzyme [Vicinamibacteria bacterium]
MSLDRLRLAWERSDRLFDGLLEGAWRAQPIPLRQPFIFYLGHLPAFAWNHLARGLCGRLSFRPGYDTLFERGIDPTDVDSVAPQADWPEAAAVREYGERVRRELCDLLSEPAFPDEGGSVVSMVVEHELMHHETLLYMVQELEHGLKRSPVQQPVYTDGPAPPPARSVTVPEGEAVLGAPPGSLPFGWDNEFPQHRVRVPRFAIDERPVTNAEFREFVRDGGYLNPAFWREPDWAWRARTGRCRPHNWLGGEEAGRVRSTFEDVPFARAAHWPAMVSWAEASAYARWRGARLPTEAEWQRAARGTPSNEVRRWPWGDEPPTERRGNFHFRNISPVPVGSHPEGASAWGVLELVGNGWEWTETRFAPFAGFEPLPRYPGYSADFFDDGHFVMLGASWATDEALLRPSFRNWFQPHYPYVFSKFRCARSL